MSNGNPPVKKRVIFRPKPKEFVAAEDARRLRDRSPNSFGPISRAATFLYQVNLQLFILSAVLAVIQLGRQFYQRANSGNWNAYSAKQFLTRTGFSPDDAEHWLNPILEATSPGVFFALLFLSLMLFCQIFIRRQ